MARTRMTKTESKRLTHNLLIVLYTTAATVSVGYLATFAYLFVTTTNLLVIIPSAKFGLKAFFVYGLLYLMMGIGFKWSLEVFSKMIDELLKLLKK